MSIMNKLLGMLNKSGALGEFKPYNDGLNPGLILNNNGAGPTPQNPGLYQSIDVPQLQCPSFASKTDRERSEQIKNMAKEGEVNAIAVMKNLAAADSSAVAVEEYYYGAYRENLADNHKRRTTVKAADMARLHKVRVHQAKATDKVNQASISAKEAIAQIRQKKQEIAKSWGN